MSGFQYRKEGDPPDPAVIDAERRQAIADLMDEAVALEADADETEEAEQVTRLLDAACRRRVKAICLHLGIRPREDDGDQG